MRYDTSTTSKKRKRGGPPRSKLPRSSAHATVTPMGRAAAPLHKRRCGYVKETCIVIYSHSSEPLHRALARRRGPEDGAGAETARAAAQCATAAGAPPHAAHGGRTSASPRVRGEPGSPAKANGSARGDVGVGVDVHDQMSMPSPAARGARAQNERTVNVGASGPIG